MTRGNRNLVQAPASSWPISRALLKVTTVERFTYACQLWMTGNRTPEEVLRVGAFGFTYFCPITSSAVMNTRYNPKDVLREMVETSWIEGLDGKMLLTSSTYRPQVNKYGVKCGGLLGMWESGGWIADLDPCGWFQWYCRYDRGRRCYDAKQISRWLKSAGPKGCF